MLYMIYSEEFFFFAFVDSCDASGKFGSQRSNPKRAMYLCRCILSVMLTKISKAG